MSIDSSEAPGGQDPPGSSKPAQEPAPVLLAALRATAHGVTITDRQGVITWVNPAFSTMTGYREEEALGRKPGELLGSGVHPESFFESLWETILAGRAWEGRIINRRKDGTLYPEQQTITPVTDDSGEITHFVAVKSDLTREVAAEAERARAWRRVDFQARLLEAVGQVVMATDEKGAITYWNRAAEKQLGWAPEEVLGRDVVEVTTAEGQEELAREIMASLARGESWTGEFRLKRKDGTTYPAMVTDSPIFDASGRVVGVVGVSTDLTQMKELEGQLLHAQKMEALGRLASGVAHDFNNLLTVIQGNILLSLEELEDGSPVLEDLEQVLDQVDRAADLTRQLLDFSRKDARATQVIRLGPAIQAMEPMLRRLVPERIELRIDPGSGTERVELDERELQQVVLNLVMNAADAIPNQGEVAIRVGQTRLTAEEAGRLSVDARTGDHITLEVQDDGEGIPEAIQDRIFEPFYTSKPSGKGTGLGLAIVFGIIGRSGGHIRLKSRPGEGATFEILLPPASGEMGAPQLKAALRGRSVAQVESSCVLVVEDDADVLAMAMRTLERASFRVLGVTDREEALELLSERGREVDLIVSDLSIPTPAQEAFTRELRRRFSTIPVILVTGSGAGVGASELSEQRVTVLEKPFAPQELVAAVQEGLEGP